MRPAIQSRDVGTCRGDLVWRDPCGSGLAREAADAVDGTGCVGDRRQATQGLHPPPPATTAVRSPAPADAPRISGREV